MTEYSAEDIARRLAMLPEEIEEQAAKCTELRGALDQVLLDHDREYAAAFETARANDLNNEESKQYAVRKVATQENGDPSWRDLVNRARIALASAEVLLEKKRNEFISVRKIASLKNDEMRHAHYGH